MEKKIAFTIKDDIYDKFCLALNLSKEEEDRALETCLKQIGDLKKKHPATSK